MKYSNACIIFSLVFIPSLTTTAVYAEKLPVPPATSLVKGIEAECFQPNLHLYRAGLNYRLTGDLESRGLRNGSAFLSTSIVEENDVVISQADILRGISIFREENNKKRNKKFSLKYSVKANPLQTRLISCDREVEIETRASSTDSDRVVTENRLSIKGFRDSDIFHPVNISLPDAASANLTCISPSKQLYKDAIRASIERDLVKRKVKSYQSTVRVDLTHTNAETASFTVEEMSRGLDYSVSDTGSGNSRAVGYSLNLSDPNGNTYECTAQYELELTIESNTTGKSGRSYYRTNLSLPGIYMFADSE